MAKRIRVELRDRVDTEGSIEFLSAETSGTGYSPFAIVRYAIDGQEQDLGLRLDLDKQVFLDHFDDEGREAIVEHAAPIISGVVGDYLSSLDWPSPPDDR
jgi:hypothetical protein